VNKEWHDEHRLPRSATVDERVVGHREHAEVCGCRPMPPTIVEELAKRKRRQPRRT
jgi:hypothetical protein